MASPISYLSPELTILCSLVSGIVMLCAGKYIGSNGKVSDTTCQERRSSCNKVNDSNYSSLEQQLERHEKKLGDIDKKLDKLIAGK